MSAYKFDLLVIGSGPAGESAALNAAKHGQQVAVAVGHTMVGGSCTHSATIPSKALRQAVKSLVRYNSNPIFRAIGEPRRLSFQLLLQNAETVIRKQVAMRSQYYAKNRIAMYFGTASFSGPNSVSVTLPDGALETVTARNIVIATGSRPYRPADVDFAHPAVFDSDSILSMPHTPRKMIIYGAGVIGCEYASIFSALGVKVDLVNTRAQLLSYLDDEISDALSYHLRTQGAVIRHGEEFERLEYSAQGVTLHLKSGKRLQGEALLWCNGRTGNTDGLALGKIGLVADERGLLNVDERYQTSVPGVFAAGDVIGFPSLASAAYDQGRSAAAAARGKEHPRYVDDTPTGIYTLPEISSIGATEKELTDACIPYEVGRAFFKETARAQISGEDVGMLKLLFHLDTLQILGVHCFGAEATEIIHIGQAIMKQPGAANNIRYFISTTFNYPTMAEAYRIAALNGLNRLTRF
ncbi:MAG: Si-specific NAD(P)(+) transhydrogenase [Gammaproteobacteria bacterium]|nr:Si-specific NAD(P)(+) transhydrogenase [Gammaproteobacteria bacterium]MBP6052160.1 Si-specific NAD(P)(+) transhydrogenase [Pseudomonadales bacterium]MBK7729279.1 Si-specific NAD(P)(+) transhydrogenase [Gammaproteobacteria bacterium]MBK8307685.1 Si-specific NAD(P)(+) transhydrogenase [Gammaproteobacteria bacterium]MBK9668143.1 Si-specific NAD(P)(+) transhydrogenase [Gammaproteobacteria bacterium]